MFLQCRIHQFIWDEYSLLISKASSGWRLFRYSGHQINDVRNLVFDTGSRLNHFQAWDPAELLLRLLLQVRLRLLYWGWVRPFSLVDDGLLPVCIQRNEQVIVRGSPAHIQLGILYDFVESLSWLDCSVKQVLSGASLGLEGHCLRRLESILASGCLQGLWYVVAAARSNQGLGSIATRCLGLRSVCLYRYRRS